MTADKPSHLVPKLRFPKFWDAPGWPRRMMGQYLSESRIKGSGGHEAKKLSVKLWGKGVIEKNEILQGSENTQYYRRRAGHFIYSKLDFLNQAFGLIPEHLDGFESTVDLPCFDISSALNGQFLLEYVQREQFYKIRGEIADGGRKARRIQVETFLEFPIYAPSEPEQQKIADCLGSLDDLIAAEGRKLEALRQHKKGLMEQLFPQPGEGVPILRFPASDDGSEWQYKMLPEIATNLDNKRIPVTEQDRIPGEVPYYGASGIVDYVKDHIFDEDLLCISEDGANLVARTYPIAFPISGRTWVNNHAHVLRFETNVTQIIVQAYLNHIDISDYITGVAQPKLNRAMLDSIPIALPPTSRELNDVAGCIASLDHLLSMQQKKIKSLSAHKKGLLSQLFPNLEEESR